MKTLTCLVFLALLVCSCKEKQKEKEKPVRDTLETFTYHKITPQEFPAVNIPGFKFPEDSTIINKWIHESKNDAIYLHGWGIWTGLTMPTDQRIPGDTTPLKVYETWLTPEEMINSIKGEPVRRSNRANLKIPHQFSHSRNGRLGKLVSINDSIHESVSYSPAAARFAIDNKIFMATTLYDYAVNQKRSEIPSFPKNTITLKPVFKLLRVTSGQKLFSISAWHGPTPDLKAFPEKDWLTYVTIDVTNSQKHSASLFHLNDFIHFKLNDEDAYFFNKQFSENSGNKFNARAGDIAILVAMHVGSREISNWTWQTFWWAPDTENVPLPSSKAIVARRPAQLRGAARHYAMSLAYYMVNPNEPYSGTNVRGNTNYAFNPYLEAGFGPGVFDTTRSNVILKSGKKIATYAGVRTNCMSCHRMSTVNPDSLLASNNSITPYVGNSFVSVSDPIFKNQLRLDFAWSVQGNLDTTGFHSFIKNLKEKK